MASSFVQSARRVAQEFRAVGRALLTPSVMAVVYPWTARQLKRVGMVAAGGAAYFSTPELSGLWALGAAVTTGLVTRAAMTVAEDVVGIGSGMAAARTAYLLSGNHQPVGEARTHYKLAASLLAGVIGLGAGGMTGIVAGGKLTYGTVKPTVVHFAVKYQNRAVTPAG